MGKRSDFERKPRDFYPTPFAAVEPLIEYLPGHFTFVEPCAGNGVLVDHLESNGGICMWASDIEPQRFERAPPSRYKDIHKNDYLELGENEMIDSEYIITNPPWDRDILHPMIEHFAPQRPTWLLFDADWMHTKQSRPYLQHLHKIVSVGRIKWFGNMTGKDNCAWYLFDAQTPPIMGTFFYGRT
jgi:hypothetical protein